jgi:DNA-binding CsgD family transcriptional regulator/PAS domain-containing protein
VCVGWRIGNAAMVTVDEFSRLVSGIYAAAVAPRLWEGALRDIHRTLGGTGGSLLRAEGARSGPSFDSTIPVAAAKSYAEHYCRLDHVLAAVEKGPVGAVRSGTELVAPQRNSEFNADWLHPNDIEDGLMVRLTGGPRPTCFVVGAPRRSESFDTPERVKLMSGLVVHFQQALRTQNRLAAVTEHSVDLAGILDTLRHGVIIVGSECAVITLNSAAEEFLRAEDGLHMRSGRIGAASAGAERELHRALHTALIGGRSGIRGGHSFACGRQSGKRSYIIHVAPLQRAGAGDRSTEASALVVITDPEHEPAIATVLWRRLYGLTKGEAEVALRITRGASPKQIADELSVSFQTVRTHLQHVFDKTNTHRQAELVHLLLASASGMIAQS